MKNLILFFSVLAGVQGWGQGDTMYFNSEKQMANYAYQNTDFTDLNIHFFKDRMFDYNDSIFNYFTSNPIDKIVFADKAIQLTKHVENWDITEQFNADSKLYPVISSFYSLTGSNAFKIPIMIYDLNVHSLKQSVREQFEENTVSDPLRALSFADIQTQHITYACLMLDTLNYPNVYFTLDPDFIISNTGRAVEYVTLNDGITSIDMFINQELDMSNLFRGSKTLSISVHFDDNSTMSFLQNITYINKAEKNKSLNLEFTNSIEERYPFGDGPNEEHPVGKMSISYACQDKVLRKPYLMIAGWGPYTDSHLINSSLEWPTPMWKMANQMNQVGLIETLNDQGFDVAILQIFPPNATILGNAVVIEDVINVLNQRAAENGSHEEIIVQGYSAGSLGARLALEMMEKKHLEQNGPHPHCRLYVSTDGEHMGANIPLGIQKAVEYLWDYERWGYNYWAIYGLRYILNAPLSRELLVHWHETMDEYGNVSCDYKRSQYLSAQFSQDHALTDVARSGFPTFTRNISISNGLHTPDYDTTDYSSHHTPFPTQTGRLIFEDSQGRHRSKIRFSSHGFQEVFLYRHKSWGNWTVKMRGVMNNQLVLDNAPGGMMFITENPINATLKKMDQETFGEASTLEYTNFCFTPTVFTHNIKNYQSKTVNGYINYNLLDQSLAYQTPYEVQQNITLNPVTRNYGYPHLAYPADHFLITPFEAVFSCTEVTEHLRFERQQNSNNPDGPEDFYGVPSPLNENNYKNFVMGEAEGFNLFLQNKSIGFYARPNYAYYVDYTSLNEIYMGQQVTNKTDFQPVSVEANAHVDAMAGVEINLKPGVHIKNGSEVHLHIGELECEKSYASGNEENSNHNGSHSNPKNPGGLAEINPKDKIILYPNPSTTAFSIHNGTIHNNSEVIVQIFNLNSSKLLTKTVALNEPIEHELSKGTYIVHIKLEGSWTSKLLIVE